MAWLEGGGRGGHITVHNNGEGDRGTMVVEGREYRYYVRSDNSVASRQISNKGTEMT